MIAPPRPFRRDQRGAALMEFALVAPFMIMTLLGFFDLGHQMYASAVLRGAVEAAGRKASLADGPTNAAVIDLAVENQVKSVAPDATFAFSRQSYSEYTNVGRAERYTDANANGVWNAGECLEDINGNGTWDLDPGRAGSGGAEDVIFYKVTVSYERMFPVGQLIGIGNNVRLEAATALKNQPFGEHTEPTVSTCS